VERAENSPASRNDIIAKRFGIPTEGYTYYFTYEETLPFTMKHDFWEMPCAMGADLSQGDDFCAFTFLFPLRDGTFGVKCRSYITELTLMQLQEAMRLKYEQFIEEGTLIVMPGSVLNIDTDVYDDLEQFIINSGYSVVAFGFDPYNAKEFVERWEKNNSAYGIVKVPQGARTESVPLGELKKMAEERMLIFDEELMSFCMGNCIVIEDTNGNRKLSKMRYDRKIDNVSALMDAYVAFKANRDSF
jgi:phage terminase large subunit-like protein